MEVSRNFSRHAKWLKKNNNKKSLGTCVKWGDAKEIMVLRCQLQWPEQERTSSPNPVEHQILFLKMFFVYVERQRLVRRRLEVLYMSVVETTWLSTGYQITSSEGNPSRQNLWHNQIHRSVSWVVYYSAVYVGRKLFQYLDLVLLIYSWSAHTIVKTHGPFPSSTIKLDFLVFPYRPARVVVATTMHRWIT